MIDTFRNAVKYLESFIPTPEKKHPGKLGIDRMRYFVESLDNPQFSYPTIHVGGTSGKGSTATLIASILSTRYLVGLHTSPHLVRINERIRIFSRGLLAELARSPLEKDISDKEFVDLINEVYPAIKKVEESELGRPSYFEIVAVLAFLYFKKQKVNIAVIEVGMGGRFDATNVIHPEVAILTNVGLDHTEILGDTVEKIARDKAGIIKSNMHVVSGVKQSSIVRTIELKCRREGASFSLLGRDFTYKIKKIDKEGSCFDYFGKNTYRNLMIPLLGRHQVENAAIALRAIELIQGGRTSPAGEVRPLREKDIRRVLSNAFILGRLEIISRKPLVILDGAHNPDKMKALVTAIKEIFPKKKVRAVIAIKSGKDAEGILKEILPICHKVIFTKFRLTTDLGDTFSYEPSELLKMLKTLKHVQGQHDTIIIDDPIIAVKETMQNAESDDFILVTGSLYLVGEIRKKFQMTNDKYYT